MKIVYFSLTGNTKKFVNKLGMGSLEINMTNPFIVINEPYILIAPTYDKEATEIANDFIEFNDQGLLKGVIGGGNLNFADLYVFTAKDLSKEYNVPLLFSFEYSGTENDVIKVKELLKGIEDID